MGLGAYFDTSSAVAADSQPGGDYSQNLDTSQTAAQGDAGQSDSAQGQ